MELDDGAVGGRPGGRGASNWEVARLAAACAPAPTAGAAQTARAVIVKKLASAAGAVCVPRASASAMQR